MNGIFCTTTAAAAAATRVSIRGTELKAVGEGYGVLELLLKIGKLLVLAGKATALHDDVVEG